MKLPLQIVFRDMLHSPAVEAEIRRRALKLDEWSGEIMSCRITVESTAGHHRQGHRYRVSIDVHVPGEEVTASLHEDEDIYVAVRDAFDAIGRRLEDYARRRRGQVKQHHEALHGRVETLSDEGVGVIVSDAGDEYHFDRSQVMHPGFEQLVVGQEVHFLEGFSNVGREARRVTRAA